MEPDWEALSRYYTKTVIYIHFMHLVKRLQARTRPCYS